MEKLCVQCIFDPEGEPAEELVKQAFCMFAKEELETGGQACITRS